MENVQTCSRCIFPASFPAIEFDENGVCNYCRDHTGIEFRGEEALLDILGSYHGPRGAYDVVVPLSGGKDSSYILYYAVTKLKLRVIAVNYNAGFQVSMATKNAQNACTRLNVPLVRIQADQRTQKKLMREMLELSGYAGSFFNYCGNCETNIRTAAINTARRHKVPFVLYGHTQLEDPPVRPSFLGMKAFVKKVPKNRLPELAYHSLKYCYYSIKQRIEMDVPLPYRFKPKGRIPFPDKDVRFVNFFDYVSWDSINKVAFLEKKLGWKHPKDVTHRFDCKIHCFANHRWLQEAGITLDGIHYATMVRENHLNRDDAVKNEQVVRDSVMDDCRSTVKEIGAERYAIPSLSL